MAVFNQFPAEQDHKGNEKQRINPAKTQPYKVPPLRKRAWASKLLTIHVQHHKATQNEKQIDPDIAIFDELCLTGEKGLPLREQYESSMK